jgi:hypothetical protein
MPPVGRSVIDLEKLRVALRRLSRGNLLIVAERAIEIVPKAKLRAVVADMVQLDELAERKRGPTPLLEEVRTFVDASLRGDYYESFNVNSRNYMEKSEGTEAFIAEIDRLFGKCVKAATKGPRATVRMAFELLLAVLHRIDEDSDSVVFFADEGGVWQVGVDWRPTLAAYFQCLAESSSSEEFARAVDLAICVANYDRSKHMAAARRVANAEQKAALRRLPAGEVRR